MPYQLIETDSDELFIKKSVALLEDAIGAALAKKGYCILGLSGGSTPKPVYEALAARPLEWQNVWIFLIDDRYVSPDHSDSNQLLIKESLITPAGIPPEHVLFPDTWKALPDCVHAYENTVRELVSKGIDAVVIGMGPDGHIASLFPPVPKEAYEGPLVLQTTTDTFAVHDRITVTMPVLSTVAFPLFLLTGEEKKNAWTEMMAGKKSKKRWPMRELLSDNAVVVTKW